MRSGYQGNGVRRRSVLASTAAALLGTGLAGCLAESTTTGSTTTDAETRDPQSRPETLTVTYGPLQPAVVVLTDDGPRVVGDGHQYLFCRLDSTADDPPDRLAFAFRLGGNAYSPGIESAGRLWRADSEGDRYDADSGTGWLVFELPEAWRADHAALSLRGAEWPVGADIRERLAATPPSLSVDWRVESGESPQSARFVASVANDGEHDTRFVATITAEATDSLVAVVSEPVPAGETVSWTATREVGEDSERAFALSWLGGRLTDAP